MNAASLKLLAQVHPDLVRVIKRAETLMKAPTGFVVTYGIRTLAAQKKLLAAGATTTMRSRHLPGKTNGLAHAVDLAVTLDGKIKWDWPLYPKLAAVVKEAAKLEGVPVEWGGDWKKFKDGPHFQLPWAKYPG